MNAVPPPGAAPAARLAPPPAVREIAARLERHGFETWCVGGAVRDALLGLAHLDWDLATAATPEQVRALFPRTVPVGLEFGTVGVLDRRGVQHEVTTFRRDVRTDGRHAEVEFGASLDDDLARRDFTINAIAFSPRTGAVHDPFGGQRDLERGIVRAVGTPAERLREDRLRALRALRFAGRFRFRIDPPTWDAIVESAPQLARLSRERVRQELEKQMDQVARPSESLALWRRAGALAVLVPELAALPDVAYLAADHVAQPDRTQREAVARSRRRNRLTTLFLDLPPDVARRVATGLRFSNRDVDWFAHAAACWRELAPRMRAALRSGPVREPEVRRWAARTGRTRFRDVSRVFYARWAAERAVAPESAPDAARAAGAHRRALRAAYRDPIELADLAVDGDDLVHALGLAPGPHLGAVLRRLLDAVVEDPRLNQRDRLLALARALGDAVDPEPGGGR